MIHVHAGATLLGTRDGLARLAAQAAMYSRGPGVDIVHTLADGVGTLTRDDIDDAVATLTELAQNTAARDNNRQYARVVRDRLADLRHAAPITLT
jgi:hypothetical protein